MTEETPTPISPVLRPPDDMAAEAVSRKGGRRLGSSNLHSKQPSALARRLKAAGVDWVEHFAMAIKAAKDYSTKPDGRRQAREDIRMWLRLLPYLITTSNRIRVKKWKGRASRAAMVALDALEGR